jgi:DNA-binding GntR family transcriptional regulator
MRVSGALARGAAPRNALPAREKLREKAYRSFTSHLLAARIRPGQFVSQRELVALTGLPLGAIRELVPRLEADGLLETVPQRGMQIANVDVKLIRNAFQLRLILEREAATRFAETAPDALIRELADAHEAILRRLRKGGISRKLLEDAQRVDWHLHDTIIDALENEIISSIYRVNSIKIRLIRLQRVLLTPALLSPAMEEHLELIAAFRRRDAKRAVRAIEHHLRHARGRALGMLD